MKISYLGFYKMKKLRNFQCPKCGVFEVFSEDNKLSAKCECGETAKRITSAARYFGNTTGKSPSVG